jgi:catechol-2,3-dioxygenase
MSVADQNNFSNMLLSHIEIYVEDIVTMQRFYTQCLGFVVTDRGQGANGMVFLSRSPNEHHQIVLNPRPSHRAIESPIDHIAFRVDNIADLRQFNTALTASGQTSIQTVSHGSSWSIYFRDPQNNRFEIFTDTPWYVNQPCQFAIDLEKSDQELVEFTLAKVKGLPGFCVVQQWQDKHQAALK